MALPTVVLVAACSGCSLSLSQSAGPTVAPAPVEPATPAPTSPATPSVHHAKHVNTTVTRSKRAPSHLPDLEIGGSTTPQAPVPAHPTAAEAAFVAGVNGFCRAWYVDQRAASIRYPMQSQEHLYDGVVRADQAGIDDRLSTLRPPPAMAPYFHQFVANEQRMASARDEMDSLDPGVVQEGTQQYLAADDVRHSLALHLGARGCDGALPPAQVMAVERATQRFVLTVSPRLGCVTLVTPDYLAREYAQTSRRKAACAQALADEREGRAPRPTNIVIVKVTAVEDLTATVDFSEVPWCGCSGLSARLYFENGRWLISDVASS